MNRLYLLPLCSLVLVLWSAIVIAGFYQNQLILSPAQGSSLTQVFTQMKDTLVGDWHHYGQLFVKWQSGLFKSIFFLVLTIIPGIFLLHYLVIGPKDFTHGKPDVFYYGALTRFVHWVAAVFFTLLVLTGLMVIFSKALGGGSMVRNARYVHILCALAFVVDAPIMFLIWVKDMFPMPYDIAWFFMLGGYLSKKKQPVPAGRFNAGQKMWFWLATFGGGAMAWTGWYMFNLNAPSETLRLFTIIHNLLGAVLTGFFIIHLYMSLFAIKGSLGSMITGYKPREEVEVMHSRYKIRS